MADHYGSAELIAGRCLAGAAVDTSATRPKIFTKWCPEPGEMTPSVVRAGVQRSLDRLGVAQIDLLQFHWWTFEHSGYLDATKELAVLPREGKIAQLRVTQFNNDHLRVLVKHRLEITSHPVCLSLLDSPAAP